MHKIKFEITKEQQERYLALKKEKPKMSELDLFTTVTGTALFIGKILFQHLGYIEISTIFMSLSKTFFWIIIVTSVIKGIKKNFNSKTRKEGIGQLIGSGISAFLMLH